MVDGPTLGRFLRPEVLLTGRETTNHRWARGLHNAGFDTLSWPAIELVPAPDGSRLVAEAVERGSVLVFVSPGLIEVLSTHGTQWAQSLRGQVLASMGPGTTQALQACGLTPSLEAQPARAEGLLPLLLERVPLGQEICILAGSRGRTWLQQQLQQSGRTVRQLVLYHNQAIPQPVRDPISLHAAVYASPSAAEAMVNSHDWLKDVPAVALGPTTAAWLRDVGSLGQVFECRQPQLSSLIEVLQQL